jgi:hypothetical protein
MDATMGSGWLDIQCVEFQKERGMDGFGVYTYLATSHSAAVSVVILCRGTPEPAFVLSVGPQGWAGFWLLQAHIFTLRLSLQPPV